MKESLKQTNKLCYLKTKDWIRMSSHTTRRRKNIYTSGERGPLNILGIKHSWTDAGVRLSCGFRLWSSSQSTLAAWNVFFSASLHLVCNWLGRTCHLYQSKVCAHLTLNKRAETHWCLAFSHIFQCTGSPGVFCFVFFVHDDIWIGFSTEVKDLILLCAPSYFCFLLNFTWLKSCRCCFSNHALFTCALMQCVWVRVCRRLQGTEVWVFIREPPLSHRIGTILNKAFICWFTISAIGRADCLNMMCKILISEYKWGFL